MNTFLHKTFIRYCYTISGGGYRHDCVRSELKVLIFEVTSTKLYFYTSLSLVSLSHVRQCIYLLQGLTCSLFGKSTYFERTQPVINFIYFIEVANQQGAEKIQSPLSEGRGQETCTLAM